MSEWRECKLLEIIELIGGGTPKTTISEYWNGEIPWLSVVDFNNGKKYVFDTEKKITQLGLENSSTKLLNTGDIIISARGTVEVIAVLAKEMTFNQSCYGVRGIAEKSITDFIYYLLKDTVSDLKQISHGGVFDTITKDTFNEIDISLPPLPEQKAIAAVLSSLDDKIDLLHRQNKTLEAMAETLFRQWFVVEAQEDWEEKPLFYFVKVIDNRGKTPPYQGIPTPYPIIEVNALTGKNRLVDYSAIRKYVSEETFNTWFRGHPKKFDSLVSTVGSIGEISMFLVEKGSIAQNVVALSEINISPIYLFEAIKYAKDEIKELDIGSVQPSIKVPHLLSIKITVPPIERMELFDVQVKSYLGNMLSNDNQIQTLESLRDTLLPKLMSGEVRVA